MAAPTSPVDGSATQTVTGTFQTTIKATIPPLSPLRPRLGTLGAVTKDDAAGTWEADYTAPASTASEQTDTVTVTATDDGALTDTASQGHNDSGNGPNAVLASNFQSVGNGRHCI